MSLHRTRSSPARGLAALALQLGAGLAIAAPTPSAPADARDDAGPLPEVTAPALETVTVAAHYEAAGAHDLAASEGRVTRSLVLQRPTSRPAELLEFVPGVIVTQHSGSGKANQYFLRGFNLDHGTDFATHVDGMPVNMPTHAHGQGYTDLNFLIPELVRSIDFRKGPYAAEDGDFASAGSARIALVDTLPRSLASMTLGQRGYARLLQAGSTNLGPGTLLHALELGRDEGPWETPQGLRRVNGLLRWRIAEGDTQQTLTAMAYQSQWRATDQVPARALADGRVGRYGAIDPSDRGETGRYSLSWNLLSLREDGEWQASAWLLRSRLSLYSNFTYALERPGTGDQFLQAETREALGGTLARVWQSSLAGRPLRTTLGVQWRHDRLDPVGLYDAQGGEAGAAVQESRVRQTSIAMYGQAELRWTDWLRTTAGLRVDRYRFDVASSVDGNGGRREAALASPRLSVALGPWRGAEFFASAGTGLHSNDGRGVLARTDPRTGESVDPAAPLVRTRGAELGVRARPLPGLQATASVWRLALDSELVFAGDAGTTAPSGASTRQGLELGLHWRATRHLALDADLSLSQARFDQPVGDAGREGREVPGAVRQVMSLGATLTEAGPWSAQLQLRWFGPRPLVQDGSVRSQGTLLASGRLGYRVNRDVRLTLDVFNLFDRRASDIDYFYVSRLPGEPAGGVADRHLHPVEPRTLRLGVIVEH